MNTVDTGSIKAGDAARGHAVFEGKGACLSCHRVNRRGSWKAPDLSDIGVLRSAGSLERSLRDPSSQMIPINRPVRAVTRDGKGDQWPPAQRRYLHRSADRCRRPAALACEIRLARAHHLDEVDHALLRERAHAGRIGRCRCVSAYVERPITMRVLGFSLLRPSHWPLYRCGSARSRRSPTNVSECGEGAAELSDGGGDYRTRYG